MLKTPLPSKMQEYPSLIAFLEKQPNKEKLWRTWAKTDLYFLIRYGLKREDIEHPWLFARCREVQAASDGYLDLWAREHYKSSIITYGLTIQDILNDPEITIGIFSHTRPIAKGFLRQIKREFESNAILKSLFPEIFWGNPQREAPKWSEDDGLIVKRKGNPKESTVEAWGLVDGQPTAKHFKLVIYDDVVTIDSVRSPDMIAKTTEAVELSYNLGADGGARRCIGTRYHYNDTYKTLMERGTFKARVYPGTIDGTIEGEPVLFSREKLAEKRRDMGPYTFACQILQNPREDSKEVFKREWFQRYEGRNEGYGMNKYILVDPANEKKKENDYTAMWVLGLSSDDNYYILDILRDRLSLVERADRLFELHQIWKPLKVGYEKYGMQADIEHIKDRQARENYRFEIVPLGGSMPKLDRIKKLVPLFVAGRIYFPTALYKTNYEGKMVDLVDSFLNEEYLAFPLGRYDMLDSLARILDADLNVVWPKPAIKRQRYEARKYSMKQGSAWTF